jgi:hypothetical protein
VTRFAAQAVAASVFLLGLALLDLGPRASAAMWLTLTPPTGAGAAAAPDDDSPSVWPPVQDAPRLQHLIRQGLDGEPSGSAGSPSAPSPAGAAPPALGTAGVVVAAPALSSLVRATLAWSEPSPPVRSMFEPPRRTGR